MVAQPTRVGEVGRPPMTGGATPSGAVLLCLVLSGYEVGGASKCLEFSTCYCEPFNHCALILRFDPMVGIT